MMKKQVKRNKEPAPDDEQLYPTSGELFLRRKRTSIVSGTTRSTLLLLPRASSVSHRFLPRARDDEKPCASRGASRPRNTADSPGEEETGEEETPGKRDAAGRRRGEGEEEEEEPGKVVRRGGAKSSFMTGRRDGCLSAGRGPKPSPPPLTPPRSPPTPCGRLAELDDELGGVTSGRRQSPPLCHPPLTTGLRKIRAQRTMGKRAKTKMNKEIKGWVGNEKAETERADAVASTACGGQGRQRL
ncbi:hypothetical protein CDD83_7848 [Cordyceps sp. RAO-2017]|nr:hypothetical protein CDD83_7848 [Cordyceps sp. RAO-2017]